jgi:bifunctional non-homologous end joining protein LigD
MALDTYKQKRNFKTTPEPAGGPPTKAAPKHKLQYLIQKHRATSLHYDFRLEHNGVLLSWAVPKGPSLDPSVKRLAMQVEDHPREYGSFEGSIPEGEYGGGTVMVWDNGYWEPEGDADTMLQKGDLKFRLHGKKLQGSWVLVRTRGFGGSDKSWLLIKHRDEFASTEDILEKEPRSVLSNRLLAQIAEESGGNVAKAATGDPAAPRPPAASPKEKSAAKMGKPKTKKRKS